MIDIGRHIDIALGRDGELGLLPPSRDLVPHFVRASQDDLCRKVFQQYADMTEAELFAYVEKLPLGRCWSKIDKVPVYWFWLVLFDENGHPKDVAGDMNVNIAQSPVGAQVDVCHFGYHVLPQFRGHRYAARAIRLTFPLLRAHGVSEAWITCHPSNTASRRACEIAGARLVDIVDVDRSNPRSENIGEDRLCRYVLPIEGEPSVGGDGKPAPQP